MLAYFTVIFVILISIVGFSLIIMDGETHLMMWIIPSLFLFFLLGTIIWMINILKTDLIVDEMGIKLMSPLRKIFIKWDQISNFKKKSIFGELSYTSKLDNRWNLRVTTKEGQEITIYYFLRNIEGLILEIEKHLKMDAYCLLSEHILVASNKSAKYRLIILFGAFLIFSIISIFINIPSFLKYSLLCISIIFLLLLIFHEKITLRVLYDNTGLLIEGYPSIRGVKHIPWDIINSIKADNNKKLILIETTKEQISLNYNELNEYERLAKLVKEKKQKINDNIDEQ